MGKTTIRPISLAILILVFATCLFLVSCGQPSQQQALELADSLIIYIYEDGFYNIPLQAMSDAGVDVSQFDGQDGPPRLPRLTHQSTVVPTLQVDDALVFYGQGPADRYAPYRPYLLETKESGPAIQLEERSTTELEALANVPISLVLEENNFYDGRPYNGFDPDPALRDPWFWETIQVQAQLAINFEVPRTPVGPAILELALVGVSSNSQISLDHDLDVLLNDRRLGTLRWDGETAVILALDIPEGALREGSNALLLDNSAVGAAPLDIARLDRLTVTYRAQTVAVDGLLESLGVDGLVSLAGFRDQPLIFDLSQPEAPILLPGEEDAAGRLVVAVDDQTKLHVVDRDRLLVPGRLETLGPPQLKTNANQADFVVIAPERFVPALEPLAENRRAQGLGVVLAPLEQIYREFAADGTGPSAINAFLRYAYNNWLPPRPAYLLLVGDASIDYRDYLGQDLPILLPAPMVPVTYSGETVSDARLADVDGDRRPDLAVGRWPVKDVDDVAALVRRTIAYEGAVASPTAIFAADGTEQRFAELNENVSQQAGLQDAAVYLNGPTSQELSRTWAEGAWLITYTGHGSLDRWGKDTLLDSNGVSALATTGAPPIVLQLTCLTGLFAHPTISSLSETMLLDRDGPVAIVAATSLTLSDDQRPFGVALLQALGDPGTERVGDAFQWAKAQLDIDSDDALREISDTFTLFGDPTALVRRPDSR